MKSGWKCEYCSHFNEVYDEVNTHELECAFNPSNRYCYTCANYKGDGFWIYGESYTCTKSLDITHHEDEGHCDGWS